VAQTEPDYYQVLQVDPKAEPAVIEAAYRKLAARYHPDVSREPDAVERMAQINRARDVLADPEQRARYDEFRRRALGAGAGAGAGVTGAAGAARPTWQQQLVMYLVQMLVGTFVLTIIFEVLPRLKQFTIPIVLLAIALWFFWLKPYIERNWGVGRKRDA